MIFSAKELGNTTKEFGNTVKQSPYRVARRENQRKRQHCYEHKIASNMQSRVRLRWLQEREQMISNFLTRFSIKSWFFNSLEVWIVRFVKTKCVVTFCNNKQTYPTLKMLAPFISFSPKTIPFTFPLQSKVCLFTLFVWYRIWRFVWYFVLHLSATRYIDSELDHYQKPSITIVTA